jgi:putative MATE family efflux protein
MIGVDALAAASVFFPAMFFFIAFVIGLSSGASVMIGQAWGAGQPDKVKAVAGTTLTVALLLATAIAIIGGLFSRQLLTALATPPNILDAASSYAQIMMISMPVTFVFILITAMMRGVGDTVTPLLALTVSTIVGLAVTPALIRGWFGLPMLGVASAAVASTVSGLFTLAWLHFHLRRRRHPLAFDAAFLHAMRPNAALLRTVLRLGIPTAIGMVVISLAELVLLGLVNGFGSHATAAYGAVNQIISYVQFPAISIAISVSIFGAQAIGRGNPGQVGMIVRTGLEMNLVLTGGLVALGYLFSRPPDGAFHCRRYRARARARAAPHHAVEHGPVRHGDGVFRGHARRRHGLDAAVDLDGGDHPGRGPGRDRAQPHHRHQGRLDRLSGHLRDHVRAADGLLRIGMAQAHDRTLDLTSCPARQMMTIIFCPP